MELKNYIISLLIVYQIGFINSKQTHDFKLIHNASNTCFTPKANQPKYLNDDRSMRLYPENCVMERCEAHCERCLSSCYISQMNWFDKCYNFSLSKNNTEEFAFWKCLTSFIIRTPASNRCYETSMAEIGFNYYKNFLRTFNDSYVNEICDI